MVIEIICFEGIYIYIYIFFFSMAQQPLGGQGRLSFSRLHDHTLDTPHSVGLLWTRDQLVAERRNILRYEFYEDPLSGWVVISLGKAGGMNVNT
jgi:hypothetical protein